ncbi:MAG: ABC transporter substrate-binding protein [Actinomycetota bacterium]|nr:ABC transporter substrate-binding protein [Actinomycetota bacterium]
MTRVRITGTMNRRQFLRLSGAGFAGAALLGAAGCGGGGTISGGQGGGGGGNANTFVFGRGADSISLDPINASDGESLRVTRQIFDGLLDFAPESTDVIPALATEIPEPEDGGRSYTFTLREGVTFHDGAEFNAEAVVFNFDRWRDSKNKYHTGGGGKSVNFSYYVGQFGGFDGDSIITNVEAVDEYTVRFSLKQPQGPFLKNVAMSPFGIASPKAIQNNVEGFWQNPVGSGPFKFVSWNRGSTVELESFEDWWGSDLPASEGGGGPEVSKVTIRAIPDNTSRVAALTGGELSAADGLTPDDVEPVEQAGLKVEYRPPLTIGYLAMNNEKAPFDNPDVRRAIYQAIDMDAIVEAFFGNTGEIATTYMPPTVPFFNDQIERFPFDPDAARQLLADAGEENLQTELWYMPIPRPYMPDGKGIAQAMQQDLKEIGVTAKLVTYEFGTYIERTGSGDHPMALLGWTGDNGDPDNFLNNLLGSASATETDALNIAYYKNPEVDKLLQKGQSTIVESEREKAYMEAQELLVEDTPWVPIAYAKPPLGFQKNVQGYQASPTGGEAFNTVTLSGGA